MGWMKQLQRQLHRFFHPQRAFRIFLGLRKGRRHRQTSQHQKLLLEPCRKRQRRASARSGLQRRRVPRLQRCHAARQRAQTELPSPPHQRRQIPQVLLRRPGQLPRSNQAYPGRLVQARRLLARHARRRHRLRQSNLSVRVSRARHSQPRIIRNQAQDRTRRHQQLALVLQPIASQGRPFQPHQPRNNQL